MGEKTRFLSSLNASTYPNYTLLDSLTLPLQKMQKILSSSFSSYSSETDSTEPITSTNPLRVLQSSENRPLHSLRGADRFC